MAVTSQSTLKELVDETGIIKNELVSCRDNLKNNLSNKGVDTSALNKIGELVNSIPTMPTKRWASGKSSLSITLGKEYPYEIMVREGVISMNLNFIPSLVIVSPKIRYLDSEISIRSDRAISEEQAFVIYAGTYLRIYFKSVSQNNIIIECRRDSPDYSVTIQDFEWLAFE